MTLVTTTTTISDVRLLQDSIAHHVAAAFEAGGRTWQATAPLLEGLVADEVLNDAPVAATRALGRALTRQAADIERSLSSGDWTRAEHIAAQLRRAHDRLAGQDAGLPAAEPVAGRDRRHATSRRRGSVRTTTTTR